MQPMWLLVRPRNLSTFCDLSGSTTLWLRLTAPGFLGSHASEVPISTTLPSGFRISGR